MMVTDFLRWKWLIDYDDNFVRDVGARVELPGGNLKTGHQHIKSATRKHYIGSC